LCTLSRNINCSSLKLQSIGPIHCDIQPQHIRPAGKPISGFQQIETYPGQGRPACRTA